MHRIAWAAGSLTAAGVLVASAVLPGAAQRLDLVPQRDLLIKGVFSRFGYVVVDQKGTIAAEQPNDGTVLIFARDGRRVSTFGRHGAGPGEFENLASLGVNDSGFWAADPWASRVTRFAATGRLNGTFAIPTTLRGVAPESEIGLFHPSVLAVAAGDTLLVGATHPAASSRYSGLIAVGHGGYSFAATSRNGELYRVLATTPPKPECVVQGSRAGESVVVPECADALAAAAGDASRIAVVEFDIAASRYTVAVIRSNGDTLFARSIGATLVPISRRARDSIVSARVKTLPPVLAQMYRTIELPKYYPPVERVLVGRDQTVWLELAELNSSHVWLVLDSIGREAALASFPASTRLMAANMRNAWGIAADSDGVESIERFRLTAAHRE